MCFNPFSVFVLLGLMLTLQSYIFEEPGQLGWASATNRLVQGWKKDQSGFNLKIIQTCRIVSVGLLLFNI